MTPPILNTAVDDSRARVRGLGLTLLVACIVVVGLLVWLTGALTVIVSSGLLALVVQPLTNRLERRGLAPAVCCALVTSILALAVLIVIITLAPVLAAELQRFSTALTRPDSGLLQQLQSTLGLQKPRLGSDLVLAQLVRTVSGFLLTGMEMFSEILSSFFSLGAIVILTFFMLKDGHGTAKRLLRLVPNRHFEATIVLVQTVKTRLSGYLRYELTLATIVAVLITLAFWLLGMPFPLLLGLVAGLAGMTPHFGFILAAALAAVAVVLVTHSLDGVIVVVIAFATVHLVRGLLSASRPSSAPVYLPPLTTMVYMLVGVQLMGLVGILLAAPLVSLVKIVITETIMVARRYRICG